MVLDDPCRCLDELPNLDNIAEDELSNVREVVAVAGVVVIIVTGAVAAELIEETLPLRRILVGDETKREKSPSSGDMAVIGDTRVVE